MIAIELRMHLVVLHYYNIINNYKNVNIQLSCLICFSCYFAFIRRCSGLLRQPWLWTGTLDPQCFLCWPAVLICSLTLSTMQCSLTLRFTPSIASQRADHSPRPREMLLMNVYWPSACKNLLKTFSWEAGTVSSAQWKLKLHFHAIDNTQLEVRYHLMLYFILFIWCLYFLQASAAVNATATFASSCVWCPTAYRVLQDAH